MCHRSDLVNFKIYGHVLIGYLNLVFKKYAIIFLIIFIVRYFNQAVFTFSPSTFDTRPLKYIKLTWYYSFLRRCYIYEKCLMNVFCFLQHYIIYLHKVVMCVLLMTVLIIKTVVNYYFGLSRGSQNRGSKNCPEPNQVVGNDAKRILLWTFWKYLKK